MTTDPFYLLIGGGWGEHKGWINLDPEHGESVFRRYAQDTPWPLEDQSVDLINAYHVMEHIPAGADRIAVMNEAHRVLKPGARMTIRVPALAGAHGNVWWTAVADPTHVSYWVKESFSYFDGTSSQQAEYGIKTWKTLALGTPRADWELEWIGTPRTEKEAQTFKDAALRANGGALYPWLKIRKTMAEFEISTDNLPEYTFPVRPLNTEEGNPFNFTLVQGRDETGWKKDWLIVDYDGTALARVTFNGTWKEMSAEALSKFAADWVFSEHGLGSEDTGGEMGVQPLFYEGLH